MTPTTIELTGTLQADGTLVLDEKPALAPGRVRVVLQVVPEAAPEEGWWPLLQRLRAQREASGYPFMNKAEMEEHLRWLREDDDRIDRVYSEIEAERRKQGPS